MQFHPDRPDSRNWATRAYDKNSRGPLSNGAYSDAAEERRSVGDPPLGNPLLGTLQNMGCGVVLLDSFRKVTDANDVALHLLEREVGATELDDRDWITHAVGRLLSRASARLPADGRSWVSVWRDSGRPIAIFQLGAVAPYGNTAVVMVDMDSFLRPRPLTLQRMFGLTAAETRLASGIAQGIPPTEMARQLQISRATVRSQLASIFAKTHTRRQAELVALLARVSILP